MIFRNLTILKGSANFQLPVAEMPKPISCNFVRYIWGQICLAQNKWNVLGVPSICLFLRGCIPGNWQVLQFQGWILENSGWSRWYSCNFARGKARWISCNFVRPCQFKAGASPGPLFRLFLKFIQSLDFDSLPFDQRQIQSCWKAEADFAFGTFWAISHSQFNSETDHDDWKEPVKK